MNKTEKACVRETFCQRFDLMHKRWKQLSNDEKIHLRRGQVWCDAGLIKKFKTLDTKQVLQTSLDEFKSYTAQVFWNCSRLGSTYDLALEKAKANFTNSNLKSAIQAVKSNQQFRKSRSWIYFLEKLKNNTITPAILMFEEALFGEDLMNIYTSYLHDPLFKEGEMIKLRANIGTDAVFQRRNPDPNSYFPHHYFAGIGRRKLKESKDKTFVIIDVQPSVMGYGFLKTYTYKEKQGGCRYYKVLPIGETQIYFVYEKFIKKHRPKGLKREKIKE